MIKLKNITFSYEKNNNSNNLEKKVCLNNVSLSVKEGEFIVLCGESGCGKTTLTRLINGLIPHYYEGELSGDVFIDNNSIIDWELYETAKKVGSVFQNPKSQFFNIDTTSELAFGCENIGVDKKEIAKRIKNTVKVLNLKKLLDRSLFKLSGGEKQKIACGSISSMDSNIMVLDEPSSNLDMDSIEDLKEILNIWKKQGKTIIISEHRLYYLMSLADRFIYMKDGCIVRELSPKDCSDLQEEERLSLGLRVTNLNDIPEKSDIFISNTYKKIDIKKFRFSYKNSIESLCIDHASFNSGRIIGIIGNNGAGKSTFARCLCGLQGKAGELYIDNTLYLSKKRLDICYMVMQDVNHQLFAESVLDEVLISMKNYDVEKARNILKSFGLLEFEEVHPTLLSGGQKQRLAIATAIASERRVLILDEPTSGLDYRYMIEVSKILKMVNECGVTIFVITHDPEFIMTCCSDIIHMEDGHIYDQYELNPQGITKIKNFFLNGRCTEEESI